MMMMMMMMAWWVMSGDVESIASVNIRTQESKQTRGCSGDGARDSWEQHHSKQASNKRKEKHKEKERERS